jgi:hypothetical protein
MSSTVTFSPPFDFSFIGAHEFSLPVERFRTLLFYRNTIPLPDIESVILGYLEHCGGETTVTQLGQALGLAVQDIPEQRVYRDEAECALLDKWLKDLEHSELLDAKLLRAPTLIVALTEAGKLAAAKGYKYSYHTAEAGFCQLEGLAHLADFPFVALERAAQISKVEEVTSLYALQKVCQEPQVAARLLHQLKEARLLLDAEILQIGTAHRAFSDPVCITGQFYRSLTPDDYVVGTACSGVDIAPLSAVLQADTNAAFLAAIAHDCEFELLIGSPNSNFDLKALRRFADKWDYAALLPDPRLNWLSEGVLDELQTTVEVSLRGLLTEHVPLPLLEANLERYISLWDWSRVSKRLSDEFIAGNILALDKQRDLLYRWDYTELSSRPLTWLTGVLNQQLASPFKSWLTYPEPFAWDWGVLSAALAEEYILETLTRLPYDRHVLGCRESQFVTSALKLELREGKIGEWDWHYLQTAVLPSQFFWDHLPQLARYLNWNILITSFLEPSAPPIQGFQLKRFLEHVVEHQQVIYPLTSEHLAWTEELIAFFDNVDLLRWESNASSHGFELNQHIAWTRDYFVRYHQRVLTAVGKTNVSRHVEDVALLVEYPAFDWDWQAISANTRLKWSKSLTARFADQIVWSALLAQFEPAALIARWDALHEQAVSLGGRAVEDVWKYFNAHLPVQALLSRHTHYREFVDFKTICARDPELVAAFLLTSEQYAEAWDWSTLGERLPLDTISELLPSLDRHYRRTKDERLHQFSRTATCRLPIDVLVSYTARFLLEWDWRFITEHIPRTIALKYAERAEQRLDWGYLTKAVLEKEDVTGGLLNYPIIVQRLDWVYVLESLINVAELIKELNRFAEIANSLEIAEQRNACWAVITRRLPINTIFPDLQNGAVSNQGFAKRDRVLRYDWLHLSNTPRLHPYLTVAFVRRYKACWDWDALSRNQYLNNSHEYLLNADLRRLWDWGYLSEFGQFIRPGKYADLQGLFKKFKHVIQWDAFSRRTTMPFEGELLLAYSEKSWDWACLSHAPSLRLSSDELLQLQAQPWDWTALSVNKGVELTLDTVSTLHDKPWDWHALSTHPDCIPTAEAFSAVLDKPWDFLAISRRSDVQWSTALLELLVDKNLDWERLASSPHIKWDLHLLKKVGKHIDWQTFSRATHLPLSVELIEAFSEQLNFHNLSRNKGLGREMSLLTAYPDRSWDWNYISSRSDLNWQEEHFHVLVHRLNWNNLAIKEWQDFSVSWLAKFAKHWDLLILARNYSLPATVKAAVQSLIERDAPLQFLQKIERQSSPWKGYVYHYAHLSNAAKIIQAGAIMSRNGIMASDTVLADSAGSVVHRRADAHAYARFYYRPHTPTQFFNECLGIDRDESHITKWFEDGMWQERRDSYYPRAKSFGHPKCPVPVFFRFKIKEVLAKRGDLCRISTGNMQSNYARIDRIENLLSQFNADDLYLHAKTKGKYDEYKQYSQQEFLVKDALHFNDLDYVEILVQTDSDKKALLSMIGKNHRFADHIVVDSGYGGDSLFHGKNKRVNTTYEDLTLEVETRFRDDYELVVETAHPERIADIDSVNFKRIGGRITAQSSLKITFHRDTPFSVYFHDMKKPPFLLYDNQPINSAEAVEV